MMMMTSSSVLAKAAEDVDLELEGVRGLVASEDVDCSIFKKGVICPLNIDNVLDIDGYESSTRAECQYSCFR